MEKAISRFYCGRGLQECLVAIRGGKKGGEKDLPLSPFSNQRERKGGRV